MKVLNSPILVTIKKKYSIKNGLAVQKLVY